jgi:hypothetical protein
MNADLLRDIGQYCKQNYRMRVNDGVARANYPTACVTGGAFAPRDLAWPPEYRGRYFLGGLQSRPD